MAVLAVLALTTGASATAVRVDAIDPGTRVNGMLVYQDIAQRAQASLFGGGYCDPVVLSPGRRIRTCGTTIPPHVSRLFVGHGIFAPKRAIDRIWNRLTWAMWIDGQRVDLDEFGFTDRWLYDFAPADYKPVVLREWAIMLVGAQGPHSIRYRTRWPSGVTDTTWKFTVRRS
jgi:hypothetical protein